MPQAETEQQPREVNVAGHLAAHGNRHIGRIRLTDHAGHQMQHGRVQWIEQMRDAIVGTIDRQRVLNEVVGADREKIELPQKHRQRNRRGRNFDHAADQNVIVEFAPLFLQLFFRARNGEQGLPDFADRSQHRNQDTHIAIARRAQQGTQLRIEDRRFREAIADRA